MVQRFMGPREGEPSEMTLPPPGHAFFVLGRNLRPLFQPPQEGPQLVALQVPQPGPAELVNLPSLEWLKADMSFFTFLLLHFGQDTAWLPNTRVSNVFLHFSQRNSKIGICFFLSQTTSH
jgi:hypothetical protein